MRYKSGNADLVVLAEAPGPNSIAGVQEVVTALSKLLPDSRKG